MQFLALAGLVVGAGLALLYAPWLLPWVLGVGLAAVVWGLFQRELETLVATLLSPAASLRDVPGRLDAPRAAIADWGHELRREQGLERNLVLVQRAMGALLHLAFAVVALAAEISLFFPAWLLMYEDVHLPSFLGLSPEAVAPWAFLLALPVFLSVFGDLKGWTHFGPWSDPQAQGRQLVGAAAAVGAGCALLLFIAAAGLRSEGFVADTATTPPPAVATGETPPLLPPADLDSLLAPTATTNDAGALSDGLASFEQQRELAMRMVSVTSVVVLAVAALFTFQSLGKLVVILLLAGAALLALLLRLLRLGLELMAFVVYWLARLAQALFDLLSRVAVLVAAPLAGPLGLEPAEAPAVVSDAPAARRYEEQAASPRQAAPADAAPQEPQAAPDLAPGAETMQDPAPMDAPRPDGEPDDEPDRPSRNWRPFG